MKWKASSNMNNILSKDKKIKIEKEKNIYIDNSYDIEIINPVKCNIYFLSINKSAKVNIYMQSNDSVVNFYYSTMNKDNNNFELNVYHNAKNTVSHVYNHGVNLNGNKLSFNINGYIDKESTGSSCNQENMIINVEDGVSTILPKLYIDCYDSTSSHSAYIGKFKDEEIFYLESRGLSKKKAYKLLIKSFLIPIDSAKKIKEEYLNKIEKIGGDLFE